MSVAELEELNSLVQGATGPESVFPALRSRHSAKGDQQADALEKEYVRLTKLASPELYAGDPNAQSTARRILARLYELHQQALDALGIYESVDSGDSQRAITSSTTSTQSPPA